MAREYLQNIKSENRLSKIRLIKDTDRVIGGQPSDNADEFTSNTPFLDIACTLMYALAEIGRVDKKDIPKILDALGDSRTAGASQRIVNEVNKLAKNAETAANLANDKANQAKQEAYNADQKAIKAQKSADINAKNIENKSDKFIRYLQDEHINNAIDPGIYALSSYSFATIKNGYPVNLNSTCVIRVSIRGGNDRLVREIFTESRYLTSVFDKRTPAEPVWIEYFNDVNTFSDKTGFLKNKNNNINAMIAADLLQKLSDSTTEAVSAKVVNDVNRKAVNAETIGINADAKAVKAQKKADQVPEPKAKNFVIGSDTTTYGLMTVDEVKALLNVPKLMTSSNNTNGWRLDLETGVIEQWGTANTNAQNDLVVNFPIPFPNKSFGVQALAWTGDKDINRAVILTSSVKKEAFTAKVNNSSNTTFYWVAKGH